MSDKDLMKDTDKKEKKEIEHNGEIYWFKLKDISGFELYDILDENLTINDGEEEIDIANYQKDYLEEVIVDTNVDIPTSVFIEGCKPVIYNQIKEWVKLPNDFEDVGDKGN